CGPARAGPAFARRHLSRPIHLQALLVPRCGADHACPERARPEQPGRADARSLPGAPDRVRLLPLAGRRMGFQWPGAVDVCPVLAADRTAAKGCMATRDPPWRQLDTAQTHEPDFGQAARGAAAGRVQRGTPRTERLLLLG